MKVAALLETEITSGGGFNQAVNAILQMARLSQNRFSFSVYTTLAQNIPVLQRLGIEATLIRRNFVDKILPFLTTSELGRKFLSRFNWVGLVERSLINDKIDLVYFLSPTQQALAMQKLNFILTVWDMCHRDHPEFPEIKNKNEFLARDHLYRNAIASSFLALTDSPKLSEKIAAAYGVEMNRLLAMPFSPAVSEEKIGSTSVAATLKKYDLNEGYFFYPAQLWAHKNHYRILEALKVLQQRQVNAHFVFAGGDKGNLAFLQSAARSLGVSEQVKFLGFVPAEDMANLYRGCSGVVMPTYFGPTNLPPLEAWAFGKPLVYSAQFKDQVGDAALLVDVDDAESLANAIEELQDGATKEAYTKKGYKRLSDIDVERMAAEKKLADALLAFERRRRNWGHV